MKSITNERIEKGDFFFFCKREGPNPKKEITSYIRIVVVVETPLVSTFNNITRSFGGRLKVFNPISCLWLSLAIQSTHWFAFLLQWQINIYQSSFNNFMHYIESFFFTCISFSSINVSSKSLESNSNMILLSPIF